MTIVKDLICAFLTYLYLFMIYTMSISASLFMLMMISIPSAYATYPAANVFYPSFAALAWFWCLLFFTFLPVPLVSITVLQVMKIFLVDFKFKNFVLVTAFVSIFSTFTIMFLLSKRSYEFSVAALIDGSWAQPILAVIALGNIFYFYLFYKIFCPKSDKMFVAE